MRIGIFRSIVGIIVLLLPLSSLCQDNTLLSWEDLSKVSFITFKDRASGMAELKPIFSEELEALEGRRVQVTGYIIPLDTEGFQYALSAKPQSSCFFCGQGGKESVIDLNLASSDRRYQVDEIVRFEGIFEINRDPYSLCYVLKEARPVKN